MPPLQQDDGNTAATIGNPATAEFEVCRTSLLPGALKTLGAHVCVGLEGLCGQEPGGGGRGMQLGWRLCLVRSAGAAAIYYVPARSTSLWPAAGAANWRLL